MISDLWIIKLDYFISAAGVSIPQIGDAPACQRRFALPERPSVPPRSHPRPPPESRLAKSPLLWPAEMAATIINAKRQLFIVYH
jgi:hypothetical protein